MNYRDIFLTLVYVILLIIMFSFIAIILSSGVGDMKLSWAFYGFAMITSIICILSIFRSGRKRLVYWGMSAATILMTALLITSIILSKPTESAKMQIIAYITLLLVIIINGISLYLLTQKSKMIEIPIDTARKLNIINKDNKLIENLTNTNTPESFSPSLLSPPPEQFNQPPPPEVQSPPPEQFNQPSPQFNQPSPQFNQPSPQFNQPSPQFNQPPPQFNQPPPQFNQPPSQFNQPPSRQFIPPGPISNE